MADDPKATMVIEGLNEYLFKPGRKERMEPRREVRWRPEVAPGTGLPPAPAMEEGPELPREEQFLLGQVLINLLLTAKTEGMTPGRIRLLGKLVDRLEEKTESGEAYEAGEVALGLMRDAARHNGMGYRGYVLAQVWDVIGSGEAGEGEI